METRSSLRTDAVRPGDDASDPFGIDGPEYTDAFREAFCLGYEYARIVDHVARRRPRPILIHAENVDRARDVARSQALIHWFATDADTGWVEFGLGPRPVIVSR